MMTGGHFLDQSQVGHTHMQSNMWRRLHMLQIVLLIFRTTGKSG